MMKLTVLKFCFLIIFIFLPARASDEQPPELNGSSSPFLIKTLNIGSIREKAEAWQKFKKIKWAGQENHRIALITIIQRSSEPYKNLAYVELTLNNDLISLRDFETLVIFAPEPYKSYAWQEFELHLEHAHSIHGKNMLINIVQSASESYSGWAWSKLLSSSSDTRDHLWALARSRKEPYAKMSWELMCTKRIEDLNGSDLTLLKEIVNSGNSYIRYKKAAIARILLIPWLTAADREKAERLSQLFNSVPDENNYSINWSGFRIGYDDSYEYDMEIR